LKARQPRTHSQSAKIVLAALTGRPTGTFGKKQKQGRLAALQQAAGMLNMGNLGDTEMEKLRTMLVADSNIMVAMFDILRKVDSKVLMLLKLNELTRALDHALNTTHPPVSVSLFHSYIHLTVYHSIGYF
jgi:aarF domain-containing kinase